TPELLDPKRVRFDVRFPDGVHWQVREQMELNAHQTVTDFYAERVDRPVAPPVAVYLDGWAFHGADTQRTDGDAERRASLRATGTRVWCLTRDDVKSALAALNENRHVPRVLPLH